MKKNILIVVLILLLGASLVAINYRGRKMEEGRQVVEAMHDQIVVWKDKDSINHAKISVIETARVTDFINIMIKDSTINYLQSVAEKYKSRLKSQGSVVVVEGSTSIDQSFETTIDSIPSLDNVVYPTYISEFNLDDWVSGKVVSNRDSTLINLQIKNRYSVIVGQEREGFFKPYRPTVEVVNDNPYTETQSLRAYQVAQDKRKRITIAPSVNFGWDIYGDPHFTLGVSVQPNFLNFKL